MKELNDDDFDKVFRTRITDAIPEFDNESWLKMEKKLRKRERRAFYLYASILLVLLSFGFGFYLLNRNMILKGDVIAGKKVENKKDSLSNQTAPSTSTALTSAAPTIFAATSKAETKSHFKIAKGPISIQNRNINIPITTAVPSIDHQTAKNEPNVIKENTEAITNGKTTVIKESITASTETQTTQLESKIAQIDLTKVEESIKKDKKQKEKRKIPIILALNVGPDFNSTTKVIGGKAKVAFGLGLEVGITKNLSLQTGINYGRKDYAVSSTDNLYSGSYLSTTTVDINAQCKVLEIPLRASLKVREDKKRTITINAGLSSYMMLREKYVFEYNSALTRTNKIMDVRNGGQHILSVVDLSATYNIKLENKKLALGLEPYIKIPLAGIGENSVPLKSSGLSLKLSYDFTKKR
jgi:hypothetical protein